MLQASSPISSAAESALCSTLFRNGRLCQSLCADPGRPKALPLIIANFIVYGLCLYSIKALYFSTIDELLIPKRLAGTASGIISLLTYAPEIFLYTVSGQMVDKYVGTSTPFAGYIHCFIWMAVLSVIGFITGIVLRRLNKKAIERMRAQGLAPEA